MSSIIIAKKRFAQPRQPVGFDRNYKITFAYNAASNVETRVGTVSNTIFTQDIASFCSGSGNRISIPFCSPDDYASSFIVIKGFATTLGSSCQLINTSQTSNYAGILVNIGATGVVSIRMGNNTGAGTANRRTLATAAGAIVAGKPFTIVIGFLSLTTGLCFINGQAYALTATGTSAGYSAGSGLGQIHASYQSGVFTYGNQHISLAAVVENKITPNDLKLSLNPWSIFKPEQRFYFNTTVSGSTLTGDNSTQSNTSSAAGISQTHSLAGNDATQNNTSSTGAIGQTHVLTGANSAQSNQSSAGSISTDSTVTLTGSGATQSNLSSSGAVGQSHVLTGANSSQASASSVGAIITDGSITLSGADVNQLNQSTSGAIGQTHVLTGANSNQQNLSSTAGIINPLEQAMEPRQGFIVYSQARRYTSSSSPRRYLARAEIRQYKVNHVG